MEGAGKTIFIITTDGLENASREYDKAKIKTLIEKHKDWEFMYIGANIDSYSEGCSIGIKEDNIANYEKSSKGIGKMFPIIHISAAFRYGIFKIEAATKPPLNSSTGSNEIINTTISFEKYSFKSSTTF